MKTTKTHELEDEIISALEYKANALQYLPVIDNSNKEIQLQKQRHKRSKELLEIAALFKARIYEVKIENK